ncbi:ubiquitin carboxyl-terminal hydrolase [Anaeramoeba flamelloides]|uniref:Ubiquitin carboxyl-terminal hydrolase n=1 Tax=Anaeramoeba flamelloides TaxID=1746091 RepID=A0AAV8AHT6_9EUKA|nr:ubiquitin carboxyl-terminal hydrolase [Anaeramoeba flamelloides]
MNKKTKLCNHVIELDLKKSISLLQKDHFIKKLKKHKLRCKKCKSAQEYLWFCLSCGFLGCSRLKNKHSELHYEKNPKHNLFISLSSRAIWCYECNMEIIQKIPRINSQDLQEAMIEIEPESDLSDNKDKDKHKEKDKDKDKDKEKEKEKDREKQKPKQDKEDNEEYWTKVLEMNYFREILALSNQVIDDDNKLLNNKEGKTKNKPLGLYNIGNTCYLNSSLQALSHIKPINNYFNSCLFDFRDRIKKNSIVHSYYLLINQMFSKKKKPKAIKPSGFYREICKINPYFAGFGQQDAQELLLFILDSFHESLKIKKNNSFKRLKNQNENEKEKEKNEEEQIEKENKKEEEEEEENTSEKKEKEKEKNKNEKGNSKKNQNSYQSYITDILQGRSLTTVVCKKCKTISKTYQNFNFLSLPIPNKSRIFQEKYPKKLNEELTVERGFFSRFFHTLEIVIQDCLLEFCKPSSLTGKNKYYCYKCKKTLDASATIEIKKLPEVLILHLKRFKYSSRFGSKISTKVRFPIESLDMQYFISKDQKNTKNEKEKENGKENENEKEKEKEKEKRKKKKMDQKKNSKKKKNRKKKENHNNKKNNRDKKNEKKKTKENPKNQPILYDLVSLIKHSGGLGGGHYIACAKSIQDGKWYNFNDHYVSSISESSVRKEQAYVLFYQKRSSKQHLKKVKFLKEKYKKYREEIKNENEKRKEKEENQEEINEKNEKENENGNEETDEEKDQWKEKEEEEEENQQENKEREKIENKKKDGKKENLNNLESELESESESGTGSRSRSRSRSRRESQSGSDNKSETGKKYAVSKIWWKKISFTSSPGRVNNRQMLCEHKNFWGNERDIKKFIIVDYEIWDYIQKEFDPKAIPLTSFKKCTICQKKLKSLKKRIQDEFEKSKVAKPSKFLKGDPLYIISASWINYKWKRFIYPSKKGFPSIPPKINNSVLFDTKTKKLRKNLQKGKDYYFVSKVFWDLLNSIYGCDVVIERKEKVVYLDDDDDDEDEDEDEDEDNDDSEKNKKKNKNPNKSKKKYKKKSKKKLKKREEK